MTSIIFFLIFIPILSFVLLGINFLLAPHNPYKEKKTPFECGYHSFLSQNRTQFTISFFIFALLFLIFDLEIVLIYPYTVSSYANNSYGLIVMILFTLIVTVGFIFELGKGALKIESKQSKNIESKNSSNLKNNNKYGTMAYIPLESSLYDSFRTLFKYISNNKYVIRFSIFNIIIILILRIPLKQDDALGICLVVLLLDIFIIALYRLLSLKVFAHFKNGQITFNKYDILTLIKIFLISLFCIVAADYIKSTIFLDYRNLLYVIAVCHAALGSIMENRLPMGGPFQEKPFGSEIKGFTSSAWNTLKGKEANPPTTVAESPAQAGPSTQPAGNRSEDANSSVIRAEGPAQAGPSDSTSNSIAPTQYLLGGRNILNPLPASPETPNAVHYPLIRDDHGYEFPLCPKVLGVQEIGTSGRVTYEPYANGIVPKYIEVDDPYKHIARGWAINGTNQPAASNLANILLSLRHNGHKVFTKPMLDHNPSLKNFVINAYNSNNIGSGRFGYTKDGRVINGSVVISSSFIDILRKSP